MSAYSVLDAEIQQKLRTTPAPVIPILRRSPQVNSPFLQRFPAEIRDQIYENALAPDSGPPNTTLLRTCTRIYDEAATLLYTLNPIDISLNGTYGDWPKFVSLANWEVATMNFFVNPYWPTWSVMGGRCLKWWTMEPNFRPGKINVVLCAHAEVGGIPYHVSEIGRAVYYCKGLKEGTLEIRTTKGEQARLDLFIPRLLKLWVNLVEGRTLKWDEKTPVVWDGQMETEYQKIGTALAPNQADKVWWIRINWVVV